MSGYANRNKRKIRVSKSTSDKSTIVSLYPKDIPVREYHTVFPGKFKIPYGTLEAPGTLVIGVSTFTKTVPETDESIEVPVGSSDMAASILNDYFKSLEANGANARPGIFYVEGAYDSKSIMKHPEWNARSKDAITKQLAWYKILIKKADVNWSRTRGNPLSISNDARVAAELLGLKEKPWMNDFKTMEMVACKFRNPILLS